METVTASLFVFLGIALGISFTYGFLRFKIKSVFLDFQSEKEKLLSKAEALALEGKEIALRLQAERDALSASNDDRKARISEAEKEIVALREDLRKENRDRQKAETESRRIPELQTALDAKAEALARAEGDMIELRRQIEKLEKRVAELRESFQEGVAAIQGGHFIPGSVLKSIARKRGASAKGD